jgi:hypothetical protein
MKRTSELFSILLTLALLLGLAPWATVPTRADAEPTEITGSTTEWSGNMVVNSDVTISGPVTLIGNTVLTIGEGKTLTVEAIKGNTGKNLTVNGNGTLIVGSSNSYGPGIESNAINTLTVNSGKIQVIGGFSNIRCASVVLKGGSVEAENSVYSAVTLAGGTIKARNYNNNGNVDVTVAQGYTYTLNGAGKYTGTMLNGDANMKNINYGVKLLAPCVPVAQIGENKYTSVQAAINAANNGDTVTLLADVTVDAPLTIPSSKTVILDLNGHTIDRGLAGKDAAEHGNVIEVNGTLTLKDSVGTGKITGGNNENNTGGGVYVDNDAAFTMTGGTISENQVAGSGGGVYVVGTFTMTGGTITDNNATGLGGGVCVAKGATFNVSGTPVIRENFTEGKWDVNYERYVRNDENPGSAADDVQLSATNTSRTYITVTGALTDGASIYVNKDASERVFATGSNYQIRESDAKYFHSDTDEKLVGALDNGSVKLVSASVKGNVTGGTLDYTVIAPAGAKLIAARYDGGRMTAVTVVNVTDAAGTLTLGGTGDEYRLFLVDGATCAPLCAAWSK